MNALLASLSLIILPWTSTDASEMEKKNWLPASMSISQWALIVATNTSDITRLYEHQLMSTYCCHRRVWYFREGLLSALKLISFYPMQNIVVDWSVNSSIENTPRCGGFCQSYCSQVEQINHRCTNVYIELLLYYTNVNWRRQNISDMQ